VVERGSFFTFRIEESVDGDAQACAVFLHGLKRRCIDRDFP
jgi:hypothetical protein